MNKIRIDKAISSVLDTIVSEDPPTVNDGKFMHISKKEFMNRMEQETEGSGLLRVLSVEHEATELQGLCHGYIENGLVFFDVPDWKRLVSSLRAFKAVCGEY